MKKCRIVVREKIVMPWKPTDFDLQSMDCYYESPVVMVDTTRNIFDILDELVERFQVLERFRLPTVELVEIG